MTGRGIDQILPFPGDPELHEPHVKSAMKYVELAEYANGPMKKPVDFAYIWGDALAELERMSPDLRLINLETSVTRSDDFWEEKEVLYRMNPRNISCLTAANIDCCALANNHILDWGYAGLAETASTLDAAHIRHAGAGKDLGEAEAPAILDIPGKGRIVFVSVGSATSGIPPEWAAGPERPGVNLLPDREEPTVGHFGEMVRAVKMPGDIVVVSIHWGSNWGYSIPPVHRDFAHRLIDEAGVNVIYGHSSHHVKGIEVYHEHPIFYGCGDFLNDYEGIGGYEDYRADLTLMYFIHLDPKSGKIFGCEMIPMQIRRFRLNRAEDEDASWLAGVLNRQGAVFGTWIEQDVRGGRLLLHWE